MLDIYAVGHKKSEKIIETRQYRLFSLDYLMISPLGRNTCLSSILLSD